MRRLLRWVFNFAAVLSAVLFVGVCVLWVRSWHTRDWIYCRLGDRRQWEFRAESGGGRLELWEDYWPWGFGPAAPWQPPLPRWSWDHSEFTYGVATPAADWKERLGFLWVSHPWNGQGLLRGVRCPDWAAAAVTGVLPLLLTVRLVGRHRRRRRAMRGRCRPCGYDLRATPEEGGALLDRCPECGAVVGGKESGERSLNT